MATVELNSDSFQQTVTGNPTVIIDFWAPWCAPCRAFAPSFEAVSETHPEIVFAKVNTEEHPNIATAFNVRSIPTLMVFRDSIIIYSEAGALSEKSLTELAHQATVIDMDKVRAEIAGQEGLA